ncbi:anti sigma factor C-terminal domain-containing protein [Leuconostoc mesenteroides]|uniref:anti sigma factor C-terminal domain-containing protein n=1 Tax=Leuconostoc mesenteroides TaxID=1245 RepID=UPI00224675D5|nr:anti sigma factor C-terminal domain-containing protein [Leuconostoc mesenteroides]MCX2666805.1 anti sigma factor C-terminal domain-containing protein [Leuconostoc mesenteroides subsp. mesenteroides]
MNDNQTFEKLIKKTKTKNTLKGILISSLSTIIVFLIILVGANLFVSNTMSKQLQLQNQKLNIENIAFSPNIFTTRQHTTAIAWTKSTITETRIKNIDGYHIYYPEKTLQFGLSGTQTFSRDDVDVYKANPSIIAKNTKTQEKEPIFFSRSAKSIYKNSKKPTLYTPPTHEAKTLSTMKNTLAEVALTFDKPYSYSEIKKMIPDNVMINYYWVGFGKSNTSTIASAGNYIGLNASDDGKGSLQEGSTKNNTYTGYRGLKQALTDSISLQLASHISDKNYISSIKSQLSSNLSTAKFSGVIVTGKTDNLQSLDDLNFVFASNVGLTTPIVPYETPLK